MNALVHRRDAIRERVTNAVALLALIVIGALALVGPSGLLAWSENSSKLEDHQARIALLEERRAVLANRVALLDPDHVDPDLSSELVRGNLNVAHPDEYIVDLDPQQ